MKLDATNNPFLQDWDTPFGIPPFEKIRCEHYVPAFKVSFEQHLRNIEDIVSNPEPPTFANTLEAMEKAKPVLDKVLGVYYNLTSSNSDEALQAIENEMSPLIAAHFAAVSTDVKLFERINVIYEDRSRHPMDGEAEKLVEQVHTRFVRAGAALPARKRERMKSIEEELAGLYTSFGQHVLKDTNAFEMLLTREQELDGLPISVRASAAAVARQRGYESGYVFTISRSSFTPFMQFAKNRELRLKMYEAYTHCGDNGTDQDNNKLIGDIVGLRHERARLLGFESHAHYMLDDRMAAKPENVMALLDQLWEPTKKKVLQEAKDLQAAIDKDGCDFQLEAWDWWYYTEKVLASRFELDEEELKAYFKLENVRDGAFAVVEKLYGLRFEEIEEFPSYHEDVTAYEVKDSDGSAIGVFLVDYYMRPKKRGGAWMSEFRTQSRLGGDIRPIVINVCNFPKGSLSMPCLLGLDEVTTLFHELGHGLHGLLSQVKYASLAGTNVKQDFVELPSQIMEHWAMEAEVLKNYARHYVTGEPIPQSLIEKIRISRTFNQGFATTEYLAACYLDMSWHSGEFVGEQDVAGYERNAMSAIDLISQIAPRYRSTYFQHIFTDDSYSAGYYSYIWAEVLDADGYEAFKENGLFDRATAIRFRKEILERGGAGDEMSMYRAFRGRDPVVEPLLAVRGLD
ncbi:MAG: M3 family metallopeptidase [Proteobacteria bacterium]|nr:M3 family metallopeptidase [Pseudomonadota bacterium]